MRQYSPRLPKVFRQPTAGNIPAHRCCGPDDRASRDRATGIISPGRVFATARLCRRPPVRSTACLSLAAVVQPLRIRALPGLSGTVGDHPVQPDRHGHGPAPASFHTLPARRGAAFYPQPATPAPGHPVSANRRSGDTR